MNAAAEIKVTIRQRNAVVVGVDGSKANAAAVEWAARVAHDEGVPLVIAHVVDVAMRTSPYVTGAEIRRAANEIVLGAVDQVREKYPDVEVIPHEQFGHPSATIRDIASAAQLLVLGRRGRSGFDRMLLGSVSCSVGNHAVVPTAVVPENWTESEHPAGAIVVGVDGSGGSQAALDYAASLAERKPREIRVVNVWGSDNLMPAEQLLAHGGLELWKKDAAALVESLTEPHRRKHPELTITDTVRRGHPVGTLSDESEEAQLLVVGGHRAGRLHAALVASTTNGVLHHAACPVIVIPEPA